MDDFYSEMRGIASGLLSEFKQGALRVVAVTNGNGPADDPGEPTETYHPFDGVMRGVKFKYVTGTQVLASDLQATAPGTLPLRNVSGFVEELDDTGAVIGRYKIVQVVPKPAAGQPVSFDIIVRG